MVIVDRFLPEKADIDVHAGQSGRPAQRKSSSDARPAAKTRAEASSRPIRKTCCHKDRPSKAVFSYKRAPEGIMNETRETGNLIGSDKVQGTAVYGADRQKIGSIERVMIDKVSGKVSYAVLSFGGFLGIGDDYYPLPWQTLKYDTNLEGYVTGITESNLKGAPKYRDETNWNWSDPATGRSVNDHYGPSVGLIG
jgi:hypothetical protein